MMRENRKYFIFNKVLDYTRGFIENILVEENGIKIKEGDKNRGIFISRILDCKENGMIWHRMTLRKEKEQGISYKVSVYASDDNKIIQNETVIEIEEQIKNPLLEIETKKELFAPFLRKQFYNAGDVLLHEAEGRYFWFLIEIYRQGDASAKLSNITIFFPKQTWTKYLPSIYQHSNKENTFLDRYLNIFASLYDELNDKIECLYQYFEPQSTEKEFLEWMGQWIGITDSYIWTKEQMRILLINAYKWYRIRGTKEGIANFVELYCGERPFIIETHELLPFKENFKKLDLLTKLYGESDYSFFVFVREEKIPTTNEYQTLKKIIEDVKPAQMELNLIILKPYIFLDSYSYLGINSVLGKYKVFSLDGFSVLPFVTVGRSKIETEREE